MNDGDAAHPRRFGQAADILDDALLLRVTWRAGIGKGAAVHDDVVLEILDDHGAASRVELHFAVGKDGGSGSRARGRRAAASLAAHIGLVARSDPGGNGIDRVRRSQIQRAEIRPAPGKVGDEFGQAELAEQLAPRRIDPDPAGCRNPDVAVLVALHAVGQAGLELGADTAREHTRTRQRAVAVDVEYTDECLYGVVDIEQFLVGREAQPIRLVEQIAIHDQLRLGAGHDAIDALETELPRPLDAIDRHAAIPGVREIDRAGGVHADVVGAVELLSPKVRGQHLAPPVRPLADQRRCRVLANDQIKFGVIGHAVAFVRRAFDLGNAVPRIPAPAHVARHV
ncbi:putative ferredoxin-like protein [Bradyrhizobium sp. GM6.1]